MKKVIFMLLSGTATKIYQISSFLLSCSDYLENLSMLLDMRAADFNEEVDEVGEEFTAGENIIGV